MKMNVPENKVPKSADFIRSLPFFSSLTEEEFIALRHIFIEKKFYKGNIVLTEEDSHNYMYIVIYGKVKAVHLDQEGREHILAIHQRGDFFGEMTLLDGKTSPAAVEAMEDTKAVIISKKNFDEYLLGNAKVSRQLLVLFCSRLRESWMMLRVLTNLNAEHRVRALLGHVAQNHGVKDSRGTIITIKMTHQDIADYSAVSRETVTRILSRLVKDGEIEILEDKNILLKPSFDH